MSFCVSQPSDRLMQGLVLCGLRTAQMPSWKCLWHAQDLMLLCVPCYISHMTVVVPSIAEQYLTSMRLTVLSLFRVACDSCRAWCYCG